jgi:hypothetical protein
MLAVCLTGHSADIAERSYATQGWWANDLIIPWAVFKQPFLDRSKSMPPWSLFRANFYRYDYPHMLRLTQQLTMCR